MYLLAWYARVTSSFVVLVGTALAQILLSVTSRFMNRPTYRRQAREDGTGSRDSNRVGRLRVKS